jgi:hypothetical protein
VTVKSFRISIGGAECLSGTSLDRADKGDIDVGGVCVGTDKKDTACLSAAEQSVCKCQGLGHGGVNATVNGTAVYSISDMKFNLSSEWKHVGCFQDQEENGVHLGPKWPHCH